jgi:hypothetical protein
MNNATVRSCPKCLSDRVHRSHRRGVVEPLLCTFGAEIRRCHACRSRQAWWGSFAVRVGENGNQVNRLYSAVILGSCFVFCLGIVWWLITRMPG